MVVDQGVQPIVRIYQPFGDPLDFTVGNGGRYVFRLRNGQIINTFEIGITLPPEPSGDPGTSSGSAPADSTGVPNLGRPPEILPGTEVPGRRPLLQRVERDESFALHQKFDHCVVPTSGTCSRARSRPVRPRRGQHRGEWPLASPGIKPSVPLQVPGTQCVMVDYLGGVSWDMTRSSDGNVPASRSVTTVRPTRRMIPATWIRRP